MRIASVAVLSLLLPLASTACAPSIADGAAQIYTVAQICPHEGVTVKERSDLPPHSVLKGTATPPGVDIDSVATTYEISGCSKKQLYVCARPVVGSHADPFSVGVSTPNDPEGPRLALNTPYFTETRAISIDGNRIANMAVCQPVNAPGQ